MAKNEAKITFLAETKDFRENVNKANSTLTELRSELKLNAAQMKTNGESADGLAERHELLQAELEQAESKTQNLAAQMESCTRNYGENSVEAQKLATQINNAKIAEEKIRQEIKQCNAQLEAQESAANETETALEALENTIKQQEDALEALKKEYANTALEYGDTSDAAKTLAKSISDLSKDLNTNRSKLNAVEGAAEDAGNEAESSAGGWTVLKDAIGDQLSQAIDAAAEAFKELLLNGEVALDKLQAKTGLSGSAMESFGDTAYDVFNNGFGGSLEDVTEAMGTVHTMMGKLDSASMQNVTENAMTLSDVYDWDVQESIRAVNSMMNQFGVTSDEAFNLLVQGAQNGLDQNNDLLDTVNEYSVQFKQAGFSADDMFNMLNNGAAEGTWSVDKLGDAVKEYNIRVKDGTVADALKENRKALGFTNKEVKALSAAYGKGGEEGKAAMKATLDAVLAVEDETTRYQLGVELFGTMWEDLGEDAVVALFETEGGISGVNDAMAQTKTDAYDNLSTSLTTLGRTLKNDILVPIVESITPAIKGLVDWAIDNMEILKPIIVAVAAAFGVLAGALAIGTIISGVQKAFALLNTTMLANPITLIVALIAGLVAAFIYLWNNCEGFRAFWLGLWENIKSIAATVFGVLVNFFTVTLPEAWSTFKTTCSEVWNSIWTTISTAAMNIWTSVSTWFTNTWTSVTTTVSGIWTTVTTWFSNIWTSVSTTAMNIWTSVTTWFSNLWSSLTGTVSGIWTTVTTWFSNTKENVVSTVSGLWSSVTTWFSNIWSSLTGTVSGIWTTVTTWFSNTKENVVKTVSTLYSNVSSWFSNLWSTAKTIWNNIKTSIGDAIKGARTIVTSVVDGIWEKITSAFYSVKSTVTTIWNNIKSAIEDPITAAKTTIEGVVSKIKNALNFEWSIPKPKLPHFKVSGGEAPWGFMGSGSLPKVSVSWYAKGAILEAPTLFGVGKNGNLMGGGEAGAEAVAPIDVLLGYVRQAVQEVMGVLFAVNTDNVDAALSHIEALENHLSTSDDGGNLSRLINAIEDLASRPIDLNVDGMRIATATAGANDSVSGNRLNLKTRGLALR